jgi:hypothetical protein
MRSPHPLPAQIKTILALIILCAAVASLQAGDGNPVPPKRIVISFDPKAYPNDSNFTRTDLILQIRWPDVPNDEDMPHAAYFSSIALDFGKKHSDLPESVVAQIQQIDFSSIKLEWCAHQFHLTFHCKIGETPGLAVLVFSGKDYAFTKAWINGDGGKRVDLVP